MKPIPVIWLIFTLLFFSFSVYHFIESTRSFPQFQWESYSGGLSVDFIGPSAIETEGNLKNYIKQWNEYIQKQNSTSLRINLVAAVAYLFTAFMCGIAMFTPGPFNIKDTAKYLYTNRSKLNIYRPIKNFCGKTIKTKRRS
jgi:hypothetical protein